MLTRHLRSIILLALVAALSAAPAAAAHDQHQDHAIVVPTTGWLVGEYWVQLYSLPRSADPLGPNGNPCMTLAPRVLQEASDGVTCTVEQGTAFTTAMGGACSSVEPPLVGSQNPDDETAQRACAMAGSVQKLYLKVDRSHPIDIHRPLFERFSRQRTVQIPEDPFFEGLPPGEATMTAHGWGAIVLNLGVGQHTITLIAGFGAPGSESLEFERFPHYIKVVPRSHFDEGHGH